MMAASAAAMYGQILPSNMSQPKGPGPTAAAAPAGQPEIGQNTVVATVAGIGVTVADVRKILESAPKDLAQLFQKNPQQAIQQVYLMRYLASEGEKAHLDDTSPLKEEIEELIVLLKQQILANAMVNKEQNGYLVTGEQIDDYYKKNESRWEEAKIKIILIAFKPACVVPPNVDPTSAEGLKAATQCALEGTHPLNARTPVEAQKLAADLVQQLRGGADFAKLVTQYSDDAESKAAGGDYGIAIKASSSFGQDLKKAVFAMKPGEISDPVSQGYGYYIIRLEQKTVTPLNDVRDSIVKDLRDNHLHDYLTDLNTRFTPQVQRPDFFVQPGKFLSQPPK
jgi:peptidyl-prolyl cis-trans isomerase C